MHSIGFIHWKSVDLLPGKCFQEGCAQVTVLVRLINFSLLAGLFSFEHTVDMHEFRSFFRYGNNEIVKRHWCCMCQAATKGIGAKPVEIWQTIPYSGYTNHPIFSLI